MDEWQDRLQIVVGEQVAAEPHQELLHREVPYVLPIEPAELVEVEDRPAEADVLEPELGDEIGEGELIPLVGHRPTHQSEVVEQGLGENSTLAVVVEADRVFAFGNLRGVGVAQQRQMTEDRQLPTERAVEPIVVHLLDRNPQKIPQGRAAEPVLGDVQLAIKSSPV